MNDQFSSMVNWLEFVRMIGGATPWITQQRNFPSRNNGGEKAKDLTAIVHKIMMDQSIQDVLNEECAKQHITRLQLFRQAEDILCSMAHKMHLTVIRTIGFCLTRTIMTLYDGVYFNEERLSQIQSLSMDDPVIFMPTHKSYMDFLIVSILCFNNNVPLPAIATGMDFMSSKFLGEVLRRCGSFFMKRRFNKNKFYWALFSSYVSSLLIDGDNSMEFFLEGSRSRTGKSLYPKFGLLQMCLEPFVNCDLYDLVIVPVTIDYDKIMEEVLHVYELFGYPKPKETTSGLFKARECLGKRYGNIYVNFGEPISVRKYFEGKIERSPPPWRRADIGNRLSENEKKEIRDFGFHIIEKHNFNHIITVWPYTCAFLLKMMIYGTCKRMLYSELEEGVKSFIESVGKIGCEVALKNSFSVDLRYHMNLHSELFKNYHGDFSDNSIIELQEFSCEDITDHIRNYMAAMFGETVLTSYANQMMHQVVDVCLVSLVLLTNEVSIPNIRETFWYWKLRLLFDQEFVCSPEKEKITELFDHSFICLLQTEAISVNNNEVTTINDEVLKTFAVLMQPFITKYYFIIYLLLTTIERHFTFETLFKKVQQHAIVQHNKQVRRRSPTKSVSITSDIIRNVLSSLCNFEALQMHDGAQFSVEMCQVLEVVRLLEKVSLHELVVDEDSHRSKL